MQILRVRFLHLRRKNLASRVFTPSATPDEWRCWQRCVQANTNPCVCHRLQTAIYLSCFCIKHVEQGFSCSCREVLQIRNTHHRPASRAQGSSCGVLVAVITVRVRDFLLHPSNLSGEGEILRSVTFTLGGQNCGGGDIPCNP